MHARHSPAEVPIVEVLIVLLATAAITVYLAGIVVTHRRGRAWPLWRALCWCAGIAAATASVVGPLAAAAHDSFVAHMTGHVLAGMLAPLLLVCASPVTLALRGLAPTPARRVSRLLRSIPTRVVAHPITAAALSIGGLWVIYRSPILHEMQASPLVHALVHGHLLIAGYLFTAAIIGFDPRPHPVPRPFVAAMLVLSVAAHGILAKHLYADPPTGFAAADVREGAQFMYYAGAWIEAVVITIFCAQWYRAAGRAGARPAVPSPVRDELTAEIGREGHAVRVGRHPREG